MLGRLFLATTLLLALSVSGAALAQPAGSTGDEGQTNSLITAPHTPPTGRVVPRPSSLDPATARGIETRTEQQEQDNMIMRRICLGCT